MKQNTNDFATKTDLQELEGRLTGKITLIEEKVDTLDQKMDKVLGQLDAFVGGHQSHNDEHTLQQGQIEELFDTTDALDKRVHALEHPLS